ncbi:7TM diverse intracellular signaling domain-containing protein [Lysinibacillus endophyticus]|uniref:7TM diverse intracellular signaling domain-containing protein n=2 Tax=Ureibacillus endophyticus TaxID=1978490 RepID=UPI003136D679
MKIHKIIFLLIGVMLLFVPLLLIENKENISFAHKGILDLNDSNFYDEKIIPLDGEWEFYEGELYDPLDFSDGSITNATLLNVPGPWSKGEDQGIGTYRLQIQNVPLNKILGIKKQNIRSASKIYINGELISEEGVTSDNKESYIEGNNPQLLFFQTETDTIDLVIQVSDFSYNSAGIANSLFFGEQKQLIKFHYQKVFSEVSVITILMTIGLLYILLYLFVERYRRKEFFILSFALSCIFFAIINFCLSERTILFILPDLSFEAMFKIKDISIFLATISFIFIISQYDKRIFVPWVRYPLITLYSLYILLIVFSPLNFYHRFVPIFILINAVTYLYAMVRCLYYYFKNRQYTLSGHHSIILFSIININVYLVENAILHGIRPIDEDYQMMNSNTSLKIELLGHIKVFQNDKEIRLKWTTVKVEELFSLMVLHRKNGIEKWQIIEKLWPSIEMKKAEQNLYTTIYRLKKTFLESGIQLTIENIKGKYYIELSDCSIDIEEKTDWSIDQLFGDRVYKWKQELIRS